LRCHKPDAGELSTEIVECQQCCPSRRIIELAIRSTLEDFYQSQMPTFTPSSSCFSSQFEIMMYESQLSSLATWHMDVTLFNSTTCLCNYFVTYKNNRTWGFSCCGQSCDLFCPRFGFDPLCARLSPSRCLTCSWACRMSSGPWRIVVVRVNWPGHPT